MEVICIVLERADLFQTALSSDCSRRTNFHKTKPQTSILKIKLSFIVLEVIVSVDQTSVPQSVLGQR